MSRLAGAFDEPTLVGYLVGCHPDRARFLANASALIDTGCGVLEIGIPFSDPIADGPTIQAAVTQALQAGTRPTDVLDACAELRGAYPEQPLIVMTYANIAYRMGYDTFADRLREAGLDGAILADLPPEHAGPVQEAFGDDLDLVLLASPATSDQRLDKLAAATQGFLYVVGLFGVTGARDTLDARTIALVERISPRAREHGTPIAVGFGISTGEQAKRLTLAGADGIVVGSAFVERATDPDAPATLAKLAGELADGIESARSNGADEA